jgi:hypothetical protein
MPASALARIGIVVEVRSKLINWEGRRCRHGDRLS